MSKQPTETALVVLRITYDPTRFDPPDLWDWRSLLDLGQPGDVRVIACVEEND